MGGAVGIGRRNMKSGLAFGLIAVVGIGSLGAAWWPATKSLPSRNPDKDVPTIVFGRSLSNAPRPVSEAAFTYPEMAIEANGAIYVANARGQTIELIEGTQVRTLYRGSEGSILNDIVWADDALVVLDAGHGQVLFLTPGGDVTQTLDIPVGDDAGEATQFLASSMDYANGKLLFSGIPGGPLPGGTLVGMAEGRLLEYADGAWSTLAKVTEWAPDGLKGVSFRDAAFAKDGSILALLGPYLIHHARDGSIRSVQVGSNHGGGILETNGGWLIGAHTDVVKVGYDLSVEPYPIDASLANVGGLSRTSSGDLLLTDTDRQVIYQLGDGEIRTFGSGASLKIADMEAMPDGRVAMIENSTPRLFAYDPQRGSVEVLAGTGAQVISGPKPAEDFTFHYPSGLAVGPDGDIYVAEANYRVVRIANGEVSVFAGRTEPGSNPEGKDRNAAQFGALRGMDVDAQGRLLVVDRSNHTLWRIGLDGVVERVMGTGSPGKWQEGEPAESQPLNAPMDVVARNDGSILIADTYNNSIVEVDAQGVVRRFAGIPSTLLYQGFGDYSGDGGPALEAVFNTPWRISEGADGSVYVVDQFNHAVRRIAPNGAISTVAGGSMGFAEDGSRMNLPGSAAPLNGFLFVGDSGNNVVWSFPDRF